MFDTFMQSQRLLMTSRRVIDVAIQDPIWKSMGRQVPLNPDHFFATNLKVDSSAHSEYLAISVTDSDPATAAAAVTSVINSYAELYNEQEKALEREIIGVLEDKQNSNQARIDQLNQLLREGEKEYGTADLSPFFEAAAARVTKFDSALSDIRAAMAAVPAAFPQAAPTTGPANPTGDTSGRAELSAAQIAASDPIMAGYVRDLDQLEDGLQQLLFRYGDAHQSVINARRSIAVARKRVENYVEMYRQFHAATAQSLGDPRVSTVSTVGKSLEDLRANEHSLNDLLEKAKKEMVAIGTKWGELRREGQELDSLRDQQQQLTRRIMVLRGEDQLGGRLSIISTGEIALSPDRDVRVRTAAVAGVGGAGLPIALIVLWSFARRRYHYSDDTEADVLLQQLPLLGVVPEVDHAAGDPETMDAAAHAIHQLRVTLRSTDAAGRSAVYMITSSTAGEGKTSVAISLGLSCAAAGLKTLLIDGDMVGRKLTASLGARGLEGFHESLVEKTLRRRVRRTPEGLYVLPAGNARAADACAISPTTAKHLLAEAREHFDVVLIDTGPILGSIEASVLARAADGLILTIGRGQHRHLVDKSLRRIRGLGASVVGCVFNRALMKDFSKSPYGSSSRSGADGHITPVPSGEAWRRYERFGSLVKAVVVSLPACLPTNAAKAAS